MSGVSFDGTCNGLLPAWRPVPALHDRDGAGGAIPRAEDRAAQDAARLEGSTRADQPGLRHLLPCGAMPHSRRTLAVGLACAALAIAGCGGSDTENEAAAPTATATAPPAAPAATPPATKPEVKVPKGKLPKKLVKKDLKVGTGAEAKIGSTVN